MIGTDRRSLLAGIGALLGLHVLPVDALALPAAGDGKENSSLSKSYISPEMTALATAFADTLIPHTDTPGAVDAGVPAVFDSLMRDWAAPDHRDHLLGALKAVDAAAVAAAGRPLAQLSPGERTKFLTAYDAAQFQAAPDPSAPEVTYLRLKDLVVSLYYLSEAGSTEELRYEQVPGAWEPSIPLTAQTRAWAGANVG